MSKETKRREDRGGNNRNKPSSQTTAKSITWTTPTTKQTRVIVTYPRPNNGHSLWKVRHDRNGCHHKCVTPESHFRHWRNAYSRDLNDFYREIKKRSGYIRYEDFLEFAFSVSSGHISKYA